MKKSKYTKELLEHLVKNSTSLAQILKKLNLKPTGGNYQNIKGHITKHSISINHFTGQLWNKGIIIGPNYKTRIPTNELLKKDVHFASAKLRIRLINEGILSNICSICHIGPEWNNKPMTLQLDHINGERTDNRLKNLRILCPNCHSQTPTHSGKNKK